MNDRLPNDAYWVTEGKIMAGPYPGSKDPDDARRILDSLIRAGVTTFVDLTEPGDGPPGSPLEPYEPLISERDGIRRESQPIPDVSITTREHMREILNGIEAAVNDGEVVYVHCWGGVGRAGTVVGCYLIEMGMSPDQVLDRIAELRVGLDRADRPSPETRDQSDFILGWDADK